MKHVQDEIIIIDGVEHKIKIKKLKKEKVKNTDRLSQIKVVKDPVKG